MFTTLLVLCVLFSLLPLLPTKNSKRFVCACIGVFRIEPSRKWCVRLRVCRPCMRSSHWACLFLSRRMTPVAVSLLAFASSSKWRWLRATQRTVASSDSCTRNYTNEILTSVWKTRHYSNRWIELDIRLEHVLHEKWRANLWYNFFLVIFFLFLFSLK